MDDVLRPALVRYVKRFGGIPHKTGEHVRGVGDRCMFCKKVMTEATEPFWKEPR